MAPGEDSRDGGGGEGGHDSPKAVLAALAANLGIAVAKIVGFVVTGSSAMLAEAVHSIADTTNQLLLLLGRRASRRRASAEHPFGFGRERYFYGFVVALLIFTIGCVFALYEGINKIVSPHPMDSPLVAVVILAVALCLEGYSFRTAIREARPLKGSASWWRFVHTATTPELPVLLLEDSGALVGLVFALVGVGVSELTGNPVWDGIGSVAIGALLGVIAVILIMEMKSLLIGEGAGPELLASITGELAQGKIERVIHIRTEYLSPDELLVAAKIALTAGLPLHEVARAIDEAESRVRSAVPHARLIYLEPDLDRGSGNGSVASRS
ncbi:MAG TPA: cation diffusion facilitator family transporter [Pseudonocardiaceae bacterium]|jgi:cation diffusion facilitator family transporter|nr:cation diffusion facilitator family transporter [Pseudonocardiaceae bacterium]